jgi:glycosyltransferase involved in cell wall biosynthesis
MELQKYFPFVASKYLPVIQYGVDTELFSPSSTPVRKDLQDIHSLNRPVVLFTGRFVASKGIYTLIQAIPKILQANPSVLFLFVGGGDSRQYAQELRSRGVPEDNFRFLGYVDYFDMPQVYSLASVFVVPSLYEGLPLRILEAMSCGRATVATQVCGIPEIIEQGRNGILVSPNNHEELARDIVLLLEDDSFAKKLGKRARETVIQRFSASQMASKTLDVYRRCVDGRTEV